MDITLDELKVWDVVQVRFNYSEIAGVVAVKRSYINENMEVGTDISILLKDESFIRIKEEDIVRLQLLSRDEEA